MQIGDNILDSRQVIARREELEAEQEALKEAYEDAKAAFNDLDGDATQEERCEAIETLDNANSEWSAWRDEYLEEMQTLQKLCDAGESCASDWHHGATLILDEYFPRYAEELASELHGSAVTQADWPFSCIDWDQAAEQLKADFTQIELEGESYWVRS